MAGIESAWSFFGGSDDEMNQVPSDAGPPPNLIAPPLDALSSRTDLPQRVKYLLEGTLAICSATLEPQLVVAVNVVEVQLVKRAEQLRSGEEQQICFDTLHEIKRRRADIAPQFTIALESSLARFRRACPAEVPSFAQTPESQQTLAMQEFIARAEVRQAHALHALGHRFAVLVASPIIDAEALPIGPAQLAAAVRHGCAPLEIVAEHRAMLYQSFDRVITEALDELYARVNHYLIEHRILRHLHVLVASRPRDGPRDKRPVASPSADTDTSSTESFSTMREMLSARHSAEVQAGRVGDGYVPSIHDVQSVLGALQTRPIAPMRLDGKLAQRSVPLLKQELLAHLRQVAPNGQTPRLSAEDSDAIDLVGMLFDYLTKHTRLYGSAQTLMTKLQVPVLRVALRDKSFFTRRSHPARQLLNTIAETAGNWLDDHDDAADRRLVEKMQLVVDRLTQEFNGSLALMENALRELSQHIRAIARKAEVTERRHTDAARGREKLILAREHAHAAIATRIAAARPSRLVRTLLEQAWTDVLALTMLRQGETSKMYTNRLRVADELLGTGASRSGDARVQAVLRDEIETALDQVGYHREDVQTIVKRLFEPEHAQGDDPNSSTEIAIKLKTKPHLGSEAGAAAEHEPPHQDFATGSAEARMLERLYALPFGTWFELSPTQRGERVRRKLAWFSTVTGHCLFVNRHGVRTDEKSLHCLAQEVVRGQASIIEPEQASLVDCAWIAIMTSLRQFAGRDTATKPA
jgi:hypothetical protein